MSIIQKDATNVNYRPNPLQTFTAEPIYDHYSDNYPVPLPVGSCITVTKHTQLTTHMKGKAVAESGAMIGVTKCKDCAQY
jgi:hypothetical protein